MVEAAGGLVLRGRGEDLRVLVAHRPRYDDWSFPKGKLDPGEDHLTAALREVVEETGITCAAGDELPEVRYTDHRGRPKRVRYWAMVPVEERSAESVPNEEVDEVRWCTLAEAAALLTYPHDRKLLEQVAQAPPAPRAR